MLTAVGRSALVGKVISRVEYISPHTVLLFDDGTFTVVVAREGDYHDDEPYTYIPAEVEDVWEPIHGCGYVAISIGLWTQEECEAHFRTMKQQREEQNKQAELEQLARLKAKYDR